MKRLLLLGGGHAHVKVLAQLAAQPLPEGWEVRLITPWARQIYSGMLPGWIAGHYRLADCAIALDALAARASVRLLHSAATGLDLAQHRVQCSDGSAWDFDLLSIDTGPLPALDHLPGLAAHAMPLRPIEGFVAAWPALEARIAAATQPLNLVLLGGGAAGVEVALALQYRARTAGWTPLRLSLVDAAELPLRGAPHGARLRLHRLLAERGIRWLGQRRASRVDAGMLHFAEGEPLPFDVCLAVTGAAAPAWPRAAGLATDTAGFIRVDATLRSVSHPQVFAAGDVASHATALPKSGVYAVKAGPVLAHNLAAACAGQPLRAWTPQRRALYLISTGDHHALASWGPLFAQGAWAWRWKDAIDRGFMRRYGTVVAPPAA